MTTLAAPSAQAPPPARPGALARLVRVAALAWRGRRLPPPLLVLGALVAAAAVVLPIIFLIIEAVQDGWGTLHPLLFRSLTAQLLWNSVSLAVVVSVLCAVVGTVTAWFIERTQLPGRRLWAVLVVIPLGVPDFVVSFGWRAIFPNIGGFWAATLVMTLAVYPLVYLPVAASLRNADPAQEEVARSLGLGRLRTFWRVTVGQARLAILGGAVLVALLVLAEFGAFEILGFHTLTTEIYTEFTVGFNAPAGCAFSLILVILGFLLLAGEGAARGGGRGARLGAGAARRLRPRSLGRGTPLALAGIVVLVGLALGVPVGADIYLMVRGGSTTLPAASLGGAAAHTFVYAAAAGGIATVGALPIALLSVRHARRSVRLLERTNMVVLAVPGLVVALTLVYFTEHFLAGHLYGSPVLLVLGYAVMFFPMAVVAVRAAVARAPIGLEEVGSSLGVRRRTVFRRVTLPLILPGLIAAFCLVFLESATELTATLVLIPTNTQTLATQFWAYETDLAFAQAAPYAGLIMLVAAIPGYVLGRWFDRLPSRAQAATVAGAPSMGGGALVGAGVSRGSSTVGAQAPATMVGP
jgi:iron(III) transport system permease protein